MDDLACYYLGRERSRLISPKAKRKYSNYPGELKCQGRFSISGNRNWISDILANFDKVRYAARSCRSMFVTVCGCSSVSFRLKT